MTPEDKAAQQKETDEIEEETLLSGDVKRTNYLKPQFAGLSILLLLPALLFLLYALSIIFHHSNLDISDTKPTKNFTLNPNGQDAYLEAHPELKDKGAAWAAAHGPWASQGPDNASSKQYTPVGKLTSNGTHNFEKTVMIISLDGVR